MEELFKHLASLRRTPLWHKCSIIIVCCTQEHMADVEYNLKYLNYIELDKIRAVWKHVFPRRLIEKFRKGQAQFILMTEVEAIENVRGLQLGTYDKSRIVKVLASGIVSLGVIELVRSRTHQPEGTVTGRFSSAEPNESNRPKPGREFKPVEYPTWMGKWPRQNALWSKEEDKELLLAWEYRMSLSQIAKRHGRAVSGITSRLGSLGVDYDARQREDYARRQRILKKRYGHDFSNIEQRVFYGMDMPTGHDSTVISIFKGTYCPHCGKPVLLGCCHTAR